MSDTTLRVLINIPSKKYQFEYDLLQSLIEHVRTENEDFKNIQADLHMQIIDHDDKIQSHKAHFQMRENLQPHFSVILVCFCVIDLCDQSYVNNGFI